MLRTSRCIERTVAGRLSILSAAIAIMVAVPCAFAASLQEERASSARIAAIQAVVDQALQRYHLKGIIVQVRFGGKDIYLKAAGESMTGVPVTPDMHFRNGAMAFTYMSTMLLELVDQQPDKVSLNDNVDKFLPEIRNAGNVTLKELANMTSGYQDYVYEREVLDDLLADPFRQFTPEELIKIGVTPDPWFDPGKNWAYSHTNYVILGRVLEKITGMPLSAAMQKYIIAPMGLRQTRSIDTPQIPPPVMHSFTSERREYLHLPPRPALL